MNQHDLDPDLLPWSPEAEASVLGGLLIDNAAWDAVSDLLEEKHFYSGGNGLIYGAVASLIVANKPADLITVFEALERFGKAEEIGGLPYLNSLAQSVPSAANIRRYAEIVAERALLRGMLAAADKTREIVTSKSGSTVAARLNEVVDLFQSLQVRRGRLQPRHISEGVNAMLTRLDDLANGRREPGIATCIPGFNRLLGGGLKPGKQIVIAARPSVGKSSLALAVQIALAQHQHPGGYLSQEMEQDELTDRSVANLADVDLEHLTLGKLDGQEWSRVSEAAEAMKHLPLYFDEQTGLTLADVQAKARALKRQHGIETLVLDYLQLCSGNPKADKRHTQIEEISRGTKVLAKQLGLTTFILSQLSREVERRSSGKPVLSDLKESGAIEEDADVVVLLSVSYTRPSGVKVIEAEFAKNRQGPKGSVFLAFDGALQQWVETIAQDKPLKPPMKHYTEDV